MPQTDSAGFSTGCDNLDAVLPSRHFATGALHEIVGASWCDRAAALGATLAFCARLFAERPGPVIWCQLQAADRLHLHAPGLAGFGIDPGRLIKITLCHEKDLLWAMEEALDCSYVAAVVGVLWSEKIYGFTASRRLALRARESGVTAFMLRPHRARGSTAADTRWRISGSKSAAPRRQRAFLPPMGRAQWRLEVTKCRGTKPSAWDVGWDHETLRFHMAARLADHPALSSGRPADGIRQAG